MTTVVNITKYSGPGKYIGRQGRGEDGYFGNPHPIGWCQLCARVHDRTDSIKEYKVYFDYRIKTDKEFRKRILELKDQTLKCFCKPNQCHGDIIVDYHNSLANQT